ncbi:hypothetical protein FRB98_009097 [Tulasnella sp. 332]|nr:hypothetical protein FRB98_009097 [Tulasnella sp. 332]
MAQRKNTNVTLRWGILATGGIARQFASDLLTDPSARNVYDVSHQIVAVASSSSVTKAQDFIREIITGKDSDPTTDVKACGSYEDLVGVAEVDIVYVASPASHHYPNVLMCLGGGKHVCCEKPFTINAQQTEHLIRVARKKKLFLMEAVWTRFFPSIAPLSKILHAPSSSSEAIIGRPIRLFADFSLQVYKPDVSTGTHRPGSQRRWDHRLFDPSLGGGALLDLGIYCITWACMVLMDDPRNAGEIPKVTSNMVKTKREEGISGDADGWKGEVDEHTSIVLTFEKTGSVALLTTSLAVRTPGDMGGNITIPWVLCRPESFTIDVQGADSQTHKYRVPHGHGLHWEADACARAIRDGKLEAKGCSLDTSLTVMRIMDEVRKQGGLRFPDDIESIQVDPAST